MSEFGNRDPRAPRTRWIIVTTERLGLITQIDPDITP
jgi:hypothetical protein